MNTHHALWTAAAAAAMSTPAFAAGYQHDSGEQLGNIFLANGGHALLLNQYTAQPGMNQITQIEFPWHNATGAQAEVIVWSDPNNDGMPDDASVLWSTTINGSGDGTIELIQVPVPQINVGSSGSSFFIGFSQVTPLTIQEVFTSLSSDPATFLPDRGFVLADPNHPVPATDLTGIQPIEDGLSGTDTPTLVIRAQAIPAPGAVWPLIGGGMLLSRRRRR